MSEIKFYTDHIPNPAGGGTTFDEFVEKVLNKDAAGIAAPVGEDGKPDTEKGQVISDKGEAGEGFQDGESVDGKSDGETKSKAKPKDDEKEDEKVEKEAAGPAKGEDQKESIVISLPADKEFQKGESVDASKGKKKASAEQWLKISNLNPEGKNLLKKYWLTMYPREYVDAMIQDR